MLSLKGRQDKFRLILPKEFIPKQVSEKYEKMLTSQKGFIYKPIDFLNECIQKVELLGFSDATVIQDFTASGEPMINNNRIQQNKFPHGATQINYRAAKNPISLIDKTLNITFKHTLGYISYFIIFESFLYMYSRDMKYKDMPKSITVKLYDEHNYAYAQVILERPIIDGIDMLSLDKTQPVAQSQTFNVTLKYSNIDYQFVEPNIDN